MQRASKPVSALVLVVALSILAMPVPAQAQASIPEEAKQFDFWLGTWNVGSGGFGGVDKVKRLGKGVAIYEKYTAPGGGGWSINVYDTRTQTWTQTWYAPGGSYFQVTGKKQGNDIVLVGEWGPPDDRRLLRLSYIEITKDSFTQLYEESRNGGQAWVETNRIPFTRAK
jgi:hypothetical protein